jgi:hypothetical protein
MRGRPVASRQGQTRPIHRIGNKIAAASSVAREFLRRLARILLREPAREDPDRCEIVFTARALLVSGYEGMLENHSRMPAGRLTLIADAKAELTQVK